MPLKIKPFSLLIIVFLFTKAHAYHPESMGRIVNNSTQRLDMEYKVCEFSYFERKQNGTEIKCTSKQTVLNPSEYMEENLEEWRKAKRVPNELYRIVREIFVIKVSDGKYATRFRINGKDQDNDPQAPLGSYCLTWTGGTALSIGQLSNYRYYCFK